MSLYTTEMDTAFDEGTLEEALVLITEGTTITAEVINPAGPGGGWPIVRYTGEETDLRAMLINSFILEDDEVDDFLYPV